MVTTKTQSII